MFEVILWLKLVFVLIFPTFRFRYYQSHFVCVLGHDLNLNIFFASLFCFMIFWPSFFLLFRTFSLFNFVITGCIENSYKDFTIFREHFENFFSFFIL